MRKRSSARWSATLQERCSNLTGRSPGAGAATRLHAAEQLVDVAARRAHLQRAVDARLAVVDAAEQRAAGGGQPLRGLLEHARVGHLEREVLVAAVDAVLDQDELVVALVAGEVAGAGDALGLDHADDLLLEVDGGVEVGNVEGDVPDAGDHDDGFPLSDCGTGPAGRSAATPRPPRRRRPAGRRRRRSGRAAAAPTSRPGGEASRRRRRARSPRCRAPPAAPASGRRAPLRPSRAPGDRRGGRSAGTAHPRCAVPRSARAWWRTRRRGRSAAA